jgi:hypothetical protein
MTVLMSDNRLAKVDQVRISHLAHDENTYNFFVAKTHLYFVGQHHILVHNCNDLTQWVYRGDDDYVGKRGIFLGGKLSGHAKEGEFNRSMRSQAIPRRLRGESSKQKLKRIKKVELVQSRIIRSTRTVPTRRLSE